MNNKVTEPMMFSFLHMASTLILFNVFSFSKSDLLSCDGVLNINDTITNMEFQKCRNVTFNKTNVHLNGTLSLLNTETIRIQGINTSIKCSTNSGIHFGSINLIEIHFIQFVNCGIIHSFDYDKAFKVNFISAAYFFNVSTIILSKVCITGSNGTGLVILNCKNIQISESVFSHNSWIPSSGLNGSGAIAGGGGMHVELSCGSDITKLFGSAGNCSGMNLSITDSSFLYNDAKNLSNPEKKDFGETIFTSFGKGGGLSIHLRDGTVNNHGSIVSCTFKNNTANFGGGVHIVLSNGANTNNISIKQSTFQENSAEYSSGGLDIGFVGENISSNIINISSTIFIRNSATTGGSASLFFLYSSVIKSSSIIFSKVMWTNNSAHYGAVLFVYTLQAVNVSLEPRIQLIDNIILNNTVFGKKQQEMGGEALGEGIVMTTKQSLEISGYLLFQNNQASCIYATSSTIYFNQVQATFVRNSAVNGAGLHLNGFSSMIVSEKTTITFCNNTVSAVGSAIYYYSIDKTSYVYIRFCFIQVPRQSKEVRINFLGNSAPQDPVYIKNNMQFDFFIIHANTYSSCPLEDLKNMYKNGILKFSEHCHWCNVGYLNASNEKYFYEPSSCNASQSADKYSKFNCKSGISTQENKFIQRKTVIQFIPGIKFHLPLEVHSLSCNSSESGNWSSFGISIINYGNSSIKCSKSNLHTGYITNFSLTGYPGHTGQLLLTESGFRKLQLFFNVTALNCPPLFEINSYGSCKCVSQNKIPYPEFHKCQYSYAELRLGFWIGYENVDNNATLLVSHCPLGFCSNRVDNNYLQLPETLNINNFSSTICENREGRLCGTCLPGYTVYFHTEYFTCAKTDLCHLGPLLYVLSEIVPITLLFLIVIFFDIRFTSGYLNGFIFFAQMYNSITQIGSALILKSSNYHSVSVFHRIIYKFFDFDFFSVHLLSFCLFRTRVTLDIVVFKYVTVLYALLLVFGAIWFLNRCSAKLKCRGMLRLKYSTLQGLSAFLVIVYSQCVQVSFMILNYVKIYRYDSTSYYVPFLHGNVTYFSREHLPYAIPAVICISTIVVGLPTLLIFYPLCNRIIAFLKLDQNAVIVIISKYVPLSKLKPLFDSMQGSFKDKFRFFAGLYFLYRVVIIATILQERVEWIHTFIEIELVVMLGIHTLVWPYQKRLHNVIDALVLCNLILIVILKRFTFFIAEKGSHFQKEINILHWIQMLFINAPLFIVFLIVIHGIFLRFKLNQRKQKKSEPTCSNNALLDDSILDHRDHIESLTDSYMLMREKKLVMFKSDSC